MFAYKQTSTVPNDAIWLYHDSDFIKFDINCNSVENFKILGKVLDNAYKFEKKIMLDFWEDDCLLERIDDGLNDMQKE